MNQSPITVPEGISDDAALAIMRRQHVHQLPVVDSAMRIVGLKTLDNLISTNEASNLVVLMAGGLGTRLHPITEDTPKPLIKVGDKPIIETIIRGFAESGFSNFCIAVNYKADMITNYLGDGSNAGVSIDYIHETQRMGTVGALSLLKQKPDAPFFVMNGDLLTTLNYRQLMAFHQQNGAPVTVCVREHKVTIPYGVLDVEDGRVHTVREKPVQCFLVSAGIYVLSPEVFDFITEVEALDMPTLLEKLVAAGTPPAVFPMREYWVDIGQLDDLQRASDEFSSVFSGS
ncbi:MAG: nucleotidyltransferase family protein [Fimbriimonadaceae bacterium]|nr:nucleotidyltransferase family protein [Alphaproteobacteria bacterium]